MTITILYLYYVTNGSEDMEMKTKKCKECGKEIQALKESQADYLLKQHYLSKHPEKVKINM